MHLKERLCMSNKDHEYLKDPNWDFIYEKNNIYDEIALIASTGY